MPVSKISAEPDKQYSTTTNVPSITWQDAGIVLPEENDILTGVIEDFQNAFNNELTFYNSKGDFLLSTPLGQLVTSLSAIISDRNRLLAFYLNQVDPSYAGGRMQDGIGRIYFIERFPASNTKVVGLCRGATGVQIPIGTKVRDRSGNTYAADSTYTIGDDGTVEVTFVCTQTGPVSCPAGTLTELYQLVPGWDSVINKKDGEVGKNVESPAQFEERRRNAVARNALNSNDSIMAALLTLDGVEDAYVTDNDEDSSIMIGNISLKPHSLYICVASLDSQLMRRNIATAIFNKKPPGCDMNGDVSVVIEDNSGLYSTPPTYTIRFSFAIQRQIYFNVVMARPQYMPSNAVDLIKNAIHNAFTGMDGSVKPRIGSQLLASEFYAPIHTLGTWANIITLRIGENAGDSDAVQMGINEIPALNKDNITVTFNG